MLQERLAAALAAEVGVSGRQLSQLKKAERQALLAALTAWPLPITGHEGYKKAEVTGGGLPLEQVDCRTMESRVSSASTFPYANNYTSQKAQKCVDPGQHCRIHVRVVCVYGHGVCVCWGGV